MRWWQNDFNRTRDYAVKWFKTAGRTLPRQICLLKQRSKRPWIKTVIWGHSERRSRTLWHHQQSAFRWYAWCWYSCPEELSAKSCLPCIQWKCRQEAWCIIVQWFHFQWKVCIFRIQQRFIQLCFSKSPSDFKPYPDGRTAACRNDLPL